MLSSDNNIKALRALIDASREYIGLQKSYLRLDVTEKLIRLASATVVLLIVICACLIAVYFLALAATECLKLINGLAMAYAITAASILDVKRGTFPEQSCVTSAHGTLIGRNAHCALPGAAYNHRFTAVGHSQRHKRNVIPPQNYLHC